MSLIYSLTLSRNLGFLGVPRTGLGCEIKQACGAQELMYIQVWIEKTENMLSFFLCHVARQVGET